MAKRDDSGSLDLQDEQGRKEAEERLRLSLDSVSDGAWDWNCATQQMFYSDRYLSSLGYDRSDLAFATSDWQNLVHPDDREIVSDAVQAHLKEYTPQFEVEFRMKRKGGSFRWTQGRGRVIERAADGRALRMVGVNLDITVAKKTEWALEQAEGRSRTILESAPCIIVCVDAAHRVLELNRAAAALLGYTIEELRGKVFVDWCIPEQYRDIVRERAQGVLDSGKAGSVELPVVTRGGDERVIYWSGARVLDTRGEAWAIVGTGLDITDQRRAEREREAAQRERELAFDRVRALSGPLPLCGSCGRVQDAEGSWATPAEHLHHYAKLQRRPDEKCPLCE